jgi:hypothetical protein
VTLTVQERQHRAEILALVAAATGQLTESWRHLVEAQALLLRRLAAVRPGTGSAKAIRAAVADFNAKVGEFDRESRALAERWAASDLPTAYRDGALRALAAARKDVRRFAWTADHQAAITSITAVFWADLIRRIAEAVRRAQAFARDAAEAARQPAGADPDQLLADHPLDDVVYANEHRHPVGAWAAAAFAAQAVLATNRGAINTGRVDLDTQWVEVRDGPECGWVSHQDPDHADGTLRTVEDADAHPLAHPGCVREIIPRPDLNGRPDIEDGDSA